MNNLLTRNTIFVVFLALLFTSCSKQDEQQMQNQLSDSDIKVEQKITAFLNKIKNPTKNNETIPIDQAIWNIEAGLNYSYGQAGIGLNEIITDSVFVEIPVSSDQEITTINIAEAYSELEENLQNINSGIEGEHNVVSINVIATENNNKSDSVNIKAYITFNRTLIGYPFSFNEWDYWSFWQGNGYCDGPNVNKPSDSDAAEEIQKRIHMRKAVPSGNYYYLEPQTVYFYAIDHPNINDATPHDNYYDYYFFCNWNGLPNYHDCLSPEELNFYLNSGEMMMYNTSNDTPSGLRPENKTFISCDIWPDYLVGTSVTNDDIMHNGKVEYGILHQSSTPPNE